MIASTTFVSLQLDAIFKIENRNGNAMCSMFNIIIDGNLKYCIVDFIECEPVSLLGIQKDLPKPTKLVYGVF